LFAIGTNQADFIRQYLVVDPFFWNNFLGSGLSFLDPDYKNLLLTGNERGGILKCLRTPPASQ
jgi:hypothetical protein